MARFVIAFGTTVHSFGRKPFHKAYRSDSFVVLFGPDREGRWS